MISNIKLIFDGGCKFKSYFLTDLRIEDQCRLGLGFGVFVPNEEEPVSWVMTYRYSTLEPANAITLSWSLVKPKLDDLGSHIFIFKSKNLGIKYNCLGAFLFS